MKAFIYCTKVFFKEKKVTIIMYFIAAILLIPFSVAEILLMQEIMSNLSSISIDFVHNDIYLQLFILFVVTLFSNIMSSFKAINETNLQEFGIYIQERVLLEKNLALSIEKLDNTDIKDLREKSKKFNIAKTLAAYVNLFSNIGSFIIFAGILIIYKSYSVILILLLLIIVNLKINQWRTKEVEKVYQLQAAKRRCLNYFFEMLTTPNYIQEFKITSAWRYLKERMQNIYDDNSKEYIAISKKAEYIGAVGELFFTIISVLSTILLIYIVEQNQYKLGTYVMLTQILTHLQGVVSGIFRNYSNVKKFNMQFEQQQSFLKLDEIPKCNTIFSEKAHPIAVEFKNVSFKYPQTEKYVLQNINLSIRAGEKIAIVGDNGAGKSTLIKLLIGLYQPTDGSIIYKKDNKEIEYEEVIKHTRVVFQDFLRLFRPVRENIGLGNIEKVDNDSLVLEAAKKANLNYTKEDLERYLGTEFGGIDISGGQWQRLAIARAYMKDGELLIFDEATSALDPETENELIGNYLELASEKTSVYITHRLAVTKLMDRIVVLNNGEIVEVGNHKSLIEKEAQYCAMYKAQSALYVGKS